MRYLRFLVFGIVVIPMSYAIEPIHNDSGFSRFINISAGVTSIESNTLAEFVSNKAINNLNKSPDSETFGLPINRPGGRLHFRQQ